MSPAASTVDCREFSLAHIAGCASQVRCSGIENSPENPKTFTFANTIHTYVDGKSLFIMIISADAADLKSAGRKAVGVQVPLRAP